MIDDSTPTASPPRHLDAGGSPLCGRDPAGEFVVEEPVDTTCPACLVAIAGKLAAGAAS